MTLSSSFTDFSLAELFQLIDRGRKSGCLTVCTLPNIKILGSKSQYYYIWFRQGRVVAAANKLNHLGLIEKINQRGLVKEQTIKNLCESAKLDIPLGLHLKTEGILSAEQLNLLFASQLQQVRQLFEIQKGVFKLDSKAELPASEMTGLSLRAIEVTLMTLRVLKNWAALADALPDKNSAIESIAQGQPQVHLHPLEWQVWEFANGSATINTIASQLNQPVAIIQQVAFRLMLACLVEEVPFVPPSSLFNDDSINDSLTARKTEAARSLKISNAFLQNLVGFLRSKT
jgi:Domain of unknown function (DUF4388)